MNNANLEIMLTKLGLSVVNKGAQLKVWSCNCLDYHSARLWINKSGKTTIKTLGIQKSFNIEYMDVKHLKKELIGFEIL